MTEPVDLDALERWAKAELPAVHVPSVLAVFRYAREAELVSAQFRGWQDFFAGQPCSADCQPYGRVEEPVYAKQSAMNFAWTLGWQAARESMLFKEMVRRADDSANRADAEALVNARLTERVHEAEAKVLLQTQRLAQTLDELDDKHAAIERLTERMQQVADEFQEADEGLVTRDGKLRAQQAINAEMLAALQAIVGLANEEIDGAGIRYRFDFNSPLGKQARAAIAKAEGRQP